MSKEMVMYNGKALGEEVSEYALEKGRLDYRTLARIMGDVIANSQLIQYFDWEQVLGYENDDMICQHFVISRYGFGVLREYTDEIVYYCDELDLYLWAVTHTGTSWDYVLTDIKLVEAS